MSQYTSVGPSPASWTVYTPLIALLLFAWIARQSPSEMLEKFAGVEEILDHDTLSQLCGPYAPYQEKEEEEEKNICRLSSCNVTSFFLFLFFLFVFGLLHVPLCRKREKSLRGAVFTLTAILQM